MNGVLNMMDVHVKDGRIPFSLELRYSSIMWFAHTMRRDSDSLVRKVLLGRFLPKLHPDNVQLGNDSYFVGEYGDQHGKN